MQQNINTKAGKKLVKSRKKSNARIELYPLHQELMENVYNEHRWNWYKKLQRAHKSTTTVPYGKHVSLNWENVRFVELCWDTHLIHIARTRFGSVYLNFIFPCSLFTLFVSFSFEVISIDCMYVINELNAIRSCQTIWPIMISFYGS